MASFLDGAEYPSKAYQPDFERDAKIQEYVGFYSALSQFSTDNFMKITRDEFKQNPIFSLNYAADLSDGCGMAGHVNSFAEVRLGYK